MRQNFSVFSLYRNPDLDDRIFDCLLASMATVQAEDVRASFLFVGDLNGHHQEWLSSTTRIVIVLQPLWLRLLWLLSAGCRPDARLGILYLLMTDVRDPVGDSVVAPIGITRITRLCRQRGYLNEHLFLLVGAFCINQGHPRTHLKE